MTAEGLSLHEQAAVEYANRFPWYDRKRSEFQTDNRGVEDLIEELSRGRDEQGASLCTVQRTELEKAVSASDGQLNDVIKELLVTGICDQIRGVEYANQKELVIHDELLSWFDESLPSSTASSDVHSGLPLSPANETVRTQMSYFGAAIRSSRHSTDTDLEPLSRSVLETRLQEWVARQFEPVPELEVSVRKFGRRTTSDKKLYKKNRIGLEAVRDDRENDGEPDISQYEWQLDFLDTLGYSSTETLKYLLKDDELRIALGRECDRLVDVPAMCTEAGRSVEEGVLLDKVNRDERILNLPKACQIVEDTVLKRASETVRQLELDTIGELGELLRSVARPSGEFRVLKNADPEVLKESGFDLPEDSLPSVESENEDENKKEFAAIVANQINGLERNQVQTLIGEARMADPFDDQATDYVLFAEITIRGADDISDPRERMDLFESQLQRYITLITSKISSNLPSTTLDAADDSSRAALPRKYQAIEKDLGSTITEKRAVLWQYRSEEVGADE